MATGTLTSTTIAARYKSLLKITGTANDVFHATTLKIIEDGDGNNSCIQLAQNRLEIVPVANHANAFEVSQADGTQIFNIASDTPALIINAATVTLTQDTNFVTSGGTNGMSIDGTTFSVDGSNNRVGILTATPGYTLDVGGDINITKDGLRISESGSYRVLLSAEDGDADGDAFLRMKDTDGNTDCEVDTGDDTYFCAVSGGNFGIGIASPAAKLNVISAADTWICNMAQSSSTDSYCDGLNIDFTNADPNEGSAQRFLYCEDSAAGRFTVWSNGELWQAAGGSTIDSDRRLKENIEDATPKLDDINKLKVRNFNFRELDEETGQVVQSGETASRKRLGFIAQEFEEVFPSLVMDTEIISAREAREAKEQITPKDAVLDEDGNVIEEAIEGQSAVDARPERKQLIRKALRTDVLAPMLVKAIQELSAKVEALENT